MEDPLRTVARHAPACHPTRDLPACSAILSHRTRPICLTEANTAQDLVTFNTSLSVCFHWQTTLLLWHLMVQDQVRPVPTLHRAGLGSQQLRSSNRQGSFDVQLVIDFIPTPSELANCFVSSCRDEASRRFGSQCIFVALHHDDAAETNCLSVFSEVCRPTTITFEALIACGIHSNLVDSKTVQLQCQCFGHFSASGQHLPMYIEAAQGQILYELHVMAKL